MWLAISKPHSGAITVAAGAKSGDLNAGGAITVLSSRI
jgi:hypothetical protein